MGKQKKPKSLLRIPRATRIEFAPDERRISARVGKRGQIWSLQNVVKLADLELVPHSKAIHFAPASPRVASVNTKGVIGVYDSEQGGGPLRRMKMADETYSPVFIGDAQLLVGDWAGNLVVWDIETGAEVSRLCFTERAMVEAFGVLGDGHGYARIAYKEDDKYLATFDARFTEEVAPRLRFELTEGEQQVRQLAPYPSGKHLAVRRKGLLELVELPSGKVINELVEEKMYLADLRVSPDGKLLTFSNWEQCWILDAATLEPRWIYDGKSDQVPHFSPAGQWFAIKNEVWPMEDFAPLMNALAGIL